MSTFSPDASLAEAADADSEPAESDAALLEPEPELEHPVKAKANANTTAMMANPLRLHLIVFILSPFLSVSVR